MKFTKFILTTELLDVAKPFHTMLYVTAAYRQILNELQKHKIMCLKTRLNQSNFM